MAVSSTVPGLKASRDSSTVRPDVQFPHEEESSGRSARNDNEWRERGSCQSSFGSAQDNFRSDPRKIGVNLRNRWRGQLAAREAPATKKRKEKRRRARYIVPLQEPRRRSDPAKAGKGAKSRSLALLGMTQGEGASEQDGEASSPLEKRKRDSSLHRPILSQE
jgi:hypothetical protein